MTGDFKLPHGNGKAWPARTGGKVVWGHSCRDCGGEDQRAGHIKEEKNSGRIQLNVLVLLTSGSN